uniref:mucin-like protein 2 n=1 Tax=Myodes glareolus TaxID=447135 RepID=UPI002020C76E|nr:mucin-like protein 2 [Myodes glareolus]
MKLLVLLVLLGVSTILVSCQDAGTDSPGTSETAAATSGADETSNTESGTEAETAADEEDSEATDAAPEQAQEEENSADENADDKVAEEKPKESIVDKGKNGVRHNWCREPETPDNVSVTEREGCRGFRTQHTEGRHR